MIAILKYNAGNVKSVENAVRRLGFETVISDSPQVLTSAEKVIFPGVGEAGSAMDYLKKHHLDQVLKNLKQPVLGICLGMQLLCSHSEERDTPTLGVFNTKVRKFPAVEIVPHTGWNTLYENSGKLFDGVKENSDCYFVHSFYAELCAETVATTHYILPFCAALQKDNFYAVQFHPEKSGDIGERILRNFLML